MDSISPAALALPAGAPPPGVKPNLVNPESTGPILVGVSSAFFTLMTVFVFVRIYTKAFIHRKWMLDDSKLSYVSTV